MGRLNILYGFGNEVEVPVEGIGGDATFGGEGRYCVIRAMDEGMRIDDKKCVHGHNCTLKSNLAVYNPRRILYVWFVKE